MDVFLKFLCFGFGFMQGYGLNSSTFKSTAWSLWKAMKTTNMDF